MENEWIVNTRDGLCNGDWIIIIVSEPRDRIMQYHLPRFLVGTVYLIMGDRLAFTRMDSKAGRRIEIASQFASIVSNFSTA